MFRVKPALILAVVMVTAWPGHQARAVTRCFVSIGPQAFFVEQIGGDMVSVEVMVPSGQSPATYEPTPQQLARLAGADVFFTTGVPFEKRLIEKIGAGFKNLRIVKTQAGIALKPIERHDHDGGHERGELLDPHVWLDPALARIQAGDIRRSLAEIDPSHADIFERNYQDLAGRLDSVDTVVRNILAPVRGRSIYVFHPSYGYFGDAYGLKQVAIETGGKEPSARQLADLVARAERDGVDVIFVQPQFSRRQAESIGRAIGARVETLDPLAANYLDNLVAMANTIARALGTSGRPATGTE